MRTALVVAFLLAHGLVHLAVWLPKPESDPDKPPPLQPDHSALLTRTGVAQDTTHQVSVALAVGAAVAYVLAGILVALDLAVAVPVAVVAAALGIALKLVFFNPWLLIGIGLDALVLSMALAEWPVRLV